MGWGIAQIVVYVVLLTLIAKPLGAYMAHVFRGEHTFMDRLVRPVERLTYRLCGIDETREMGVTAYAVSLLVFNLAVLLFIYLDPAPAGSPAAQPGAHARHEPHGGLQHGRELHHQHQLAGLRARDRGELPLADARPGPRELRLGAPWAWRSAVAFIRGITRRSGRELGNFWVDMTRSFLYVLLPISIVGGLFLVSQGVVQNLNGPTHAVTVQGTVQTIAQGPFASQEIIKELGTNGGGSYNANSAHPYENPSPLTNMVEMLALLAIPVEPDLHVRALRRQPETGVGAVRRGHGDPADGRGGDVRQRAEGQPDPRQARAPTRP